MRTNKSFLKSNIIEVRIQLFQEKIKKKKNLENSDIFYSVSNNIQK